MRTASTGAEGLWNFLTDCTPTRTDLGNWLQATAHHRGLRGRASRGGQTGHQEAAAERPQSTQESIMSVASPPP